MRLEQQDIRLQWDTIKPAIQALKDRYNLNWRPEDVYGACIAKRAFLYMDGSNFVILHDRINEFTAKVELFVWIAHSEDMNSLNDYFGDICEIAKGIGADMITFSSQRPGFLKVADKKGWRIRETIYELRVT